MTEATHDEPQRIVLLKAIHDADGATSAELIESTGVPRSSAVSILSKLADDGYVEREGEGGPHGEPYRYTITPKGENEAGIEPDGATGLDVLYGDEDVDAEVDEVVERVEEIREIARDMGVDVTITLSVEIPVDEDDRHD